MENRRWERIGVVRSRGGGEKKSCSENRSNKTDGGGEKYEGSQGRNLTAR